MEACDENGQVFILEAWQVGNFRGGQILFIRGLCPPQSSERRICPTQFLTMSFSC
jgi:hypothetical protein